MRTTINEDVIESLKKQFPSLHPLIFKRSLERAVSPGDLFDILSLTPNKLPLIWDEKTRCWMQTDDILQFEKFNLGKIGVKEDD